MQYNKYCIICIITLAWVKEPIYCHKFQTHFERRNLSTQPMNVVRVLYRIFGWERSPILWGADIEKLGACILEATAVT